MYRTYGPGPSLWESLLPEPALRMPAELVPLDALLDDPVFFEPFRPFFHPVAGRPSPPIETYLRLMFLKFRYRLGFEALCREVADSVSWSRFCRIPPWADGCRAPRRSRSSPPVAGRRLWRPSTRRCWPRRRRTRCSGPTRSEATPPSSPPTWPTRQTPASWPGGLPAKIDGGLEARHFLGDSAAIGLVTRLGAVDVVLEPRGFEAGYTALIAGSTRVHRGDVEMRVGGLADLVRSKELLRRAKDVEHLAILYGRFPELAPGSQTEPPDTQ